MWLILLNSKVEELYFDVMCLIIMGRYGFLERFFD